MKNYYENEKYQQSNEDKLKENPTTICALTCAQLKKNCKRNTHTTKLQKEFGQYEKQQGNPVNMINCK